jgi:hypothetical protein
MSNHSTVVAVKMTVMMLAFMLFSRNDAANACSHAFSSCRKLRKAFTATIVLCKTNVLFQNNMTSFPEQCSFPEQN